MARRYIRMQGMDRLLDRLDEVPDEIREGAQQAVEEGADAIRDQVAESVRVDTGNLRTHVTTKEKGSSGLTIDVGWFREEDYYSKFLEFGTSSISADPVLTSAAEEERGRFPDRVSEEVREELGNL